MWRNVYKNQCTVAKTQNIRECMWWKQGVTEGHQSQFWSPPASWQCFSPWLMFSDDNIWPLKLWLFLAALNGNHCGISSAGLISCSLTQPLSLSHFVCPCHIKQLPMRTPLSLLESYVTLNLASHHPKPCDSLEAAKAFLKLSTLASFFACVCKWEWGLDARGCSIETSCGWTCANPHVQIRNTNYCLLGCVVKYTHIHTNPGMSVLRRWIHMWVVLRPPMANFCLQTGCYCIRVGLFLNWDSLRGICRQRASSVGLSWNSYL